MTQCTGCGRLAEKYAKWNPEIELCIPCTKLLPGIAVKDLSSRGERRCMCCDTIVYHGQDVCQYCVGWVVTYVGRLDRDLLDDNPFIYELELPLIRFLQTCSEQNARDYGEDSIRTYLDGDLIEVSFRGLLPRYTFLA